LVAVSFWLYQGDCVEVMKSFPPESIDAVVTDPPAGIGFMGKEWDDFRRARSEKDAGRDSVFGRLSLRGPEYARTDRDTFIAFMRAVMTECFRLLKPGGHALVWAIPKTSHWTAMGVELVGFEIRDVVMHVFGSGYPKGLRLGGGWGTCLKPAAEHWILARKPPIENVASNIAVHGVGALNIDGCRTPSEGCGGSRDGEDTAEQSYVDRGATNFAMKPGPRGGDAKGRWPANVILDEEVGALLDAQVGKAGAHSAVTGDEPSEASEGLVTNPRARVPGVFHGDKGGPSRFFYCAKSSRAERDFGCEHLPLKTPGEATEREDGSPGVNNPSAGAGRTGDGVRNAHPTIKSVSLMRWLTRLITPPGGTVLDCFAGSGSTGMACLLEGFNFVGIEKEVEYLIYAQARISAVEQGRWVEK
jgi:site-specific DNA-methyltransferase (adenine-specific)